MKGKLFALVLAAFLGAGAVTKATAQRANVSINTPAVSVNVNKGGHRHYRPHRHHRHRMHARHHRHRRAWGHHHASKHRRAHAHHSRVRHYGRR